MPDDPAVIAIPVRVEYGVVISAVPELLAVLSPAATGLRPLDNCTPRGARRTLFTPDFGAEQVDPPVTGQPGLVELYKTRLGLYL